MDATQNTTNDLKDLSALLADLASAEAPTVKVEATAVSEDDDMASLLADLSTVAASETVTADAELSEDALNNLDSAVMRSASYESQETGVVIADASTKVAVTGTTAAKRQRATTAVPPKPRDLAALPAEVFKIWNHSPGDDTDKANMISARPTQIKIAEKFDQLWMSLYANKAPSVYVVTIFKALRAKGTMTSAEIAATFKAQGLGDGTAASQTGQIMVLFAVTRIATRNGQSLVLNEDSAVVAKLDSILGAPIATAA